MKDRKDDKCRNIEDTLTTTIFCAAGILGVVSVVLGVVLLWLLIFVC